MNQFKVGDTCKLKSEGSQPTWKVIGFSDDGYATLSGPGPCRMVMPVLVEDLTENWEIVA